VLSLCYWWRSTID